jgi:hypothetical protein
MLQAFAHEASDEYRRGGPFAVIGATARACADVIVTAAFRRHAGVAPRAVNHQQGGVSRVNIHRRISARRSSSNRWRRPSLLTRVTRSSY